MAVLRSTVVGVSEKLMQTLHRLVQSNLSDDTNNVVVCVCMVLEVIAFSAELSCVILSA